MAKIYGKLGFKETEVEDENQPGVFTRATVERDFSGDLIKNSRRLETSDKQLNDVVLSNQISMLSDPYTTENFQDIRYVKFRGTAWKVTNVEVQYPRLILTLGAVYNGD